MLQIICVNSKVARKCLFASIAVYFVRGINHCGIHYVEKPTVNLLAWISLLAPNILCPKLPANVLQVYNPCIQFICMFSIHPRQFYEMEIDLHSEKKESKLKKFLKTVTSRRAKFDYKLGLQARSSFILYLNR